MKSSDDNMYPWLNVKVIVLGCGKIGVVMAHEFHRRVPASKVTMADIDEARARKAAATIQGAGWATIDTSDNSSLIKKMRGHDLALGALPGDYGYAAIRAAVKVGVNMVDVSFTAEDPTKLDAEAKERGVTVIPDCGVAPGLSNMLVGYGASRLDKVDSAHVMVGGIPEKPIPPLGYTITWSAEGLIDEYVRGACIVEGGEIVEVPALSGLEEIDFPGVGTLEAFYTDGLRTLAESLPGVTDMWEKTLRYPGHVEKVRLLRDLGFFSDKPVTVQGVQVSPRLATARLLERSLWMPEVEDLLAMQITVKGESGGERRGYVFRVLDRHDHEGKVSAMARTTGYTAAIVASELATRRIKQLGVVPPEKLGMDQRFTQSLLSELRKRNIVIEESETS
jgi:saccharopine dehydrogenase-like NADP-dependent oxidoreductase